MKKTLVALSVLAAAANVNAAEIYSTDASKVSLKGEVDAYVATTDIEKLVLQQLLVLKQTHLLQFGVKSS